MNTQREQFIERLLKALFHRHGEGFVLKGGGAMRALFGDHRLTKNIDLDFTLPRRTADSLHNLIDRAIEVAARSTRVTDLEVSRPGKAERTPRWKVNFTDQEGDRQHVEIEVSRDAARAVPGTPVQVRFQPAAAPGMAPFHVDVYDTDALIASKMAALLGRSVPRDAYDLDVLLGSGSAPGPALIEWALDRADVGREPEHAVLRANLEAMTWERFSAELLDALPPGVASRIDEVEWAELKDRVRAYLEGLLS